MRTYKRLRLPGAMVFFTVNLAQRQDSHLLITHIDALRAAFKQTMEAHPFAIEAIVIMPEHLHCIWHLPDGDDDYPMRWQLIKARFSRAVSAAEPTSASRFKKGERGIWQRRYWEHTIRDENDLQRQIDYIHYNPVKHGYVERVTD